MAICMSVVEILSPHTSRCFSARAYYAALSTKKPKRSHGVIKRNGREGCPDIPSTVNPEYFVGMLFSYISYAVASVQKYNACERYKASRRIRSGQWLYENFMRTKGRRAQDTKMSAYEIFRIYSTMMFLYKWSIESQPSFFLFLLLWMIIFAVS